MQSTKKLNGYVPLAGRLSDQSTPSGKGIQRQTSLDFLTSQPVSTVKKDHHLGIHDHWDKGYQHQSEVPWQYLVAKGKKQSERRNSGFISLVALLLFAFSMASIAINNEMILRQLETTTKECK